MTRQDNPQPEASREPVSNPQGPYPDAGLPKWLIYGFAAKMALVVAITVGVMWWAGVFG